MLPASEREDRREGLGSVLGLVGGKLLEGARAPPFELVAVPGAARSPEGRDSLGLRPPGLPIQRHLLPDLGGP